MIHLRTWRVACPRARLYMLHGRILLSLEGFKEAPSLSPQMIRG